MPTLQSMLLPVPTNWQDFETITRDSLAQTWSSPNLQKNGRPGQAQQGVDIYGPDAIGRSVGVQCKRYQNALTIKDVEAEIKNAEKFKGVLTTLFLATTSDFDAPLQQRVRILCEKRVASGIFAVGILFWDDIVAGLVMNPAVFKAHYPLVQIPHHTAVDKGRQLAALEIGYYGADVWEYTQLILGEFGWFANADPDELFAKLRVIEHSAQQLLAPPDASAITEPLKLMTDELRKPSPAAPSWTVVESLAKRVSQRCATCSSLLPVQESNVLEIGAHLGRIYHHSDDVPSQATQDVVKKAVVHVLGAPSHAEIDGVFLEASKLTSGFRWARRIYNLLEREIRFS